MTLHLFDEPKVDAHCHVLDPARFAYAPDVAYRPAGQEQAPLEQYVALMPAYGIRHALFVGPNSGYNLDNRCLLDALARGAGRFKGIAVVPHDITDIELHALRAAGVIGVAFNATVNGLEHYLGTASLLKRLASLDMLLSMQAEGEQWLALEALLRDSPVRILIDHCGRPRAGEGIQQAGFQAVLRLAQRGGVAIKLSGVQKFSQAQPPYPDAQPYIEALLAAYGPDNALWASDWPFLKAPQRLDIGPLLHQLERWLPDVTLRKKVFWETPCRWLGFKASSA